MKMFHTCWENYLSYAGNRTELAVVAFLALVQTIGLAMYHQLNGHIPVSSGVHFWFIQWQFPFPISRLFDLLLGPSFLFLSWCVMKCWWLQDDDETGYADEGVTNGMGTLVMLSLITAFLFSIVMGAVYVPVVFGAAFAVFLVAAIVWGLYSEIAV